MNPLTMTDQFVQIRELFLAALEHDGLARQLEYAAAHCADAPELRGRLEQMLRAHHQAGGFLASQAEPAPTSLPTVESPGTRIGPYKLLEQIGEGGMGLVYMAQQQQPVKRLVALKLVKPGMDSQQVIARFEAERQALAMMDHPNIAKILDAGTVGEGARGSGFGTKGSDSERYPSTPSPESLAPSSGRPYFVMELVRGIPITEFCDQQKLTVCQRLELFMQVCQAVQHAHQKGIIHRDLKPTNVLVTQADAVPLPKVIDFGIAKALGPSLTDHTLHTGFSQLIGTPLYMSPEQAEMNHFGVDTRSDVYSLGVLLYELLTATTPFDKERLKSVGFDELRRIIREEEPETVSARIARTRKIGIRDSGLGTKWSDLEGLPSTPNPEPRTPCPRLSELDWIVMKALEKDRTRRYESASALAADIQRYLSDEPVLACPPTTMYRFQKFSRKHKPALVTAAAIALCLILGTTVSAWQAVRATTAEAQATANEQKAVANEQQANANATQAQAKAQEATEQRDEAQKQRDEVKIVNEKLLATQAELKSTLYAAHMNLAHNAWATGWVVRVRELLAQHFPKPGETDVRGFEWHFLDRLGNADLFTRRHTNDVLGVAFSPDGKRLVSSGGDGYLRLWDARTGAETRVIKAAGWIRSVAFSPDGKRIARLSGDIKVFDAETGQELLTLSGAQASFLHSTVVFSPDGQQVANNGRVWDAQTGKVVFTLTANGREYRQPMVYSPDGKRLASVGNRVKVWDARMGQELLTIENSFAHSVAFSPNGKRLATAYKTFGRSGSNDVTLWDSETGQELLVIKVGNREGVSSLAFSPDGTQLIGGSWDNMVRVWDSETGQLLATLKGHTNVIDTVAYSQDGERLASASRDGTVKVWNARDLKTEEAVTFKGNQSASRAWGLAFSPDGKRLASAIRGSREGHTVQVWDVQTGQDLLSLQGHTRRVWSVAYSQSGQRLASASADKTVKVWNSQTGQELLTLKGHTEEVVGVAFSPDGTRLASSAFDFTVKVWNSETGELIQTLTGLQKGGQIEGLYAVRTVAFSHDGKRIASGANGQVKVWDASTGEVLLSLKNPQPQVASLAFSPDDKLLATSSRNQSTGGVIPPGTVKVWDAQTGQEVRTLSGHGSPVASVVFSPDGKRLASGSWDGTVKLWDVAKGQDTLTLTGHTGYVCHVAFSPDGNRLASNDSDGFVKIWDATPQPEKP